LEPEEVDLEPEEVDLEPEEVEVLQVDEQNNIEDTLDIDVADPSKSISIKNLVKQWAVKRKPLFQEIATKSER